MDVLWIVEGLWHVPDDSQGGGDVGEPWRVGELHLVALDGVVHQLGVHTGHPTLNVELAHKSESHYIIITVGREPGLYDELGDMVHIDPDGFLQTRRN